MANMLDYVKWRGDITFAERSLNEVDSLIFSTLVYFNMDGYVPSRPGAAITLPELAAAYDASPNDQSMTSLDPLPLLRSAARSDRFRNVNVGAYVCDVDPDRGIQFCASTFYLDDSSAFIAYRGTDLTVVGWREDCELSYMSETPGQSAAVDYLNMIGKSTNSPLYSGGHSKGGNFAVYAASFCKDDVQDRIIRVFSNDGPGFNKEVSSREGYSKIIGRVSKFIPESSLVGTLLTTYESPVIIKSDLHGPVQHQPFSWQVEGTAFVPAEKRSSGGTLYDSAFAGWMESFDEKEREAFVTALFDILESSGITTLNELSKNKSISHSALLKAIKHASPEKYHDISVGLKKFAAASREAVRDEAKASFKKKDQK